MAGVGDLTHHAYVKTPKGWVRGAVRLEDPGPRGSSCPGREPRAPSSHLPGARLPCGRSRAVPSPHTPSIQQVPRPSEPCGPLAD